MSINYEFVLPKIVSNSLKFELVRFFFESDSSIGNVLKSGIVFPFQVGKLNFYVCTCEKEKKGSLIL